MTDEQLAIVLEKVPIIARKIHRSLRGHLSLDDVLSSSYFGAVKAAKDYKPVTNVPFKAYLDSRVKGQIIDDIRKNSWVPRSQLRVFRKIEEAKKVLLEQLNEEPSDSQVATYLGMPIDRYKRHLGKIPRSKLHSLEFSVTNKNNNSEEKNKVLTAGIDTNPLAEEVVLTEERDKLVRKLIPKLSENQQLVLMESFYKDETSTKIAAKLGVSQSRVHQLIRSGLHTLKLILKEKGITCENYSYSQHS